MLTFALGLAAWTLLSGAVGCLVYFITMPTV